MEICPVEGYQVCRVLVTIEKSYKVEVLCILDDIDERVKKYEGFRVDVKRKSIKDKVRREVLDVVEALDIENSRASSFRMRGIHVVETKVNVIRDWSSPKTLLEVRNNKVVNVFQEKDELEYAEPLDEEAKQVTYVVQRTLCSPQALDKAFNLPIEPHPSPYLIGRIKKGLEDHDNMMWITHGLAQMVIAKLLFLPVV
uniref:Uncharacterized protein n=1 Tax=Tanacetum cinerariifolium TaxID=118510 RepID=A0A699JJM2_TANCI|nr:hypothetical protein [Tanacetum cinerariifolium]